MLGFVRLGGFGEEGGEGEAVWGWGGAVGLGDVEFDVATAPSVEGVDEGGGGGGGEEDVALTGQGVEGGPDEGGGGGLGGDDAGAEHGHSGVQGGDEEAVDLAGFVFADVDAPLADAVFEEEAVVLLATDALEAVFVVGEGWGFVWVSEANAVGAGGCGDGEAGGGDVEEEVLEDLAGDEAEAGVEGVGVEVEEAGDEAEGEA